VAHCLENKCFGSMNESNSLIFVPYLVGRHDRFHSGANRPIVM
jgi:hypothetical protein